MNKELYNIGLKLLKLAYADSETNERGCLFYRPVLSIVNEIFEHCRKNSYEDFKSNCKIYTKIFDHDLSYLEKILTEVGILDEVEKNREEEIYIDFTFPVHIFYYSYKQKKKIKFVNRFELMDI